MKLYEDGYEQCSCFWGTKPAELVKEAVKLLKGRTPTGKLKAIDLGCGEGKNSNYISENGINVIGIDQSDLAIHHANQLWKNSSALFITGDMQSVDGAENSFDLAVSTGSIHCLESEEQVLSMITKIKRLLRLDGIFVFSSFNDRKQDLSGHPTGFNPILLGHEFFLSCFDHFEIIYHSDKDLIDAHPHNNIPHIHSITRILARRK